MNNEFNPIELIEYSLKMAERQLDTMDDEECVAMVRSFTELMAEWQPEIAKLADQPVQLGIAVSSLATLFNLAFVRAYSFTEKKMAAQDALEKAFSKEVD